MTFLSQIVIITSGLLLLVEHLIVFFSAGTIMTSKTYFGCPCPPTISFVRRLGSALLYGACSGLITIVNKLVLTTYGYVLDIICDFCSWQFRAPIT